MQGRSLAAGAVLVFSIAALSGCITGAPEGTADDAQDEPTLASDLDGHRFDENVDTSHTLQVGPYAPRPVEAVTITSFDGTELAAGLWRPDVPDSERVPVILQISPYFGFGLYDESGRTKEFFVDGFVRHGYAYAQVAIRGTSFSKGCMESMGPNEQQDIDEMISWFAQQPWSNGNIAVIGLSYVGTTPWVAAASGNPAVKAIVPMAGISDWFELGFRNGTAEPRTPFHMPLYWAAFGVGTQGPEMFQGDDAQGLIDNACTAPGVGTAASAYAIATGEAGPYAEYWDQRAFQQRVLDHYQGAVFIVHGFRDWNVNIDMAYPFARELEDKGLEVKMLLGQWQHTWPDSRSADEHRRLDFAETLLRWFDVHLKNQTKDTGPVADVEDTLGAWRAEATWPPLDAEWTALHLGNGVLSLDETAVGQALLMNPGAAFDSPDCGSATPSVPSNAVWFELPLDQELRFAGLAQLGLTVVPSAPAQEIQAELYHVADGNLVRRVAHAVMDLRFHEGGRASQVIVPGEPLLARMEFYPADVAIPAGDQLALAIFPDAHSDPCTQASRPTSEDAIQGRYLPGQTPGPLVVQWGSGVSMLRLPVIERDVGDGRYPGQP